MIDISGKAITEREARAQVKVFMQKDTLLAIKERKIKKGDVLEVARVSAIMAAKKTHELIPMCHPLNIEHIGIDFSFFEDGIKVESKVKVSAKTGVEMEALLAASIAALTIYDMCKSIDRSMSITDLLLLEKRGGRSGEFVRENL